MANEPSWEDIFKPAPVPEEAEPARPAEPVQPAAQPQQPAAYPAQPTYPPTQSYPAQPAAPQPTQYPAAPAQPVQQPYPLQEPPAYGAPVPSQPRPTQAFPAQQAEPTQPAQDSFSQLFSPLASDSAPAEGLTRREARESASGGSGGSGNGSDDGGPTSRYPGRKPEKKKRKLLWLKILLPIVIVFGGAGVAGWYAWTNYEEQVRELLGMELPTDYEGTGNGEEVVVTVSSGDIGADVANTLHDAGVTMTFDAVYDLLLEDPDIGFLPGNWRLQKEMSAQSAIDALQDIENKVTSQLLITEGTVLPDTLEIIAETTGIPIEEVQAAAADPTQYGVPAEAPSLEGYLFPATYELDGNETATQVLQKLVDTMFQHLDAAGVPVEDRHEILTMAGIIQREAGWNPDDFYKVSRVFYNRLDQGINLESDATVAYGTGNLHTVWTSDAERADASNPYNTYANPGLPIGPIGAPGDVAIEASLHPADGPWLFFVPINLQTGETVFSETADQHQAAVDVLLAWCDASTENAAYCE